MMHRVRLCVFIGLVGISSLVYALPPINLFRPSDRPLQPSSDVDTNIQFTVAYEQGFAIHGFRDTKEGCATVSSDCEPDLHGQCNVLKIYQDEQDAIAALRGFDARTLIGQTAQLFDTDDDSGIDGLLYPCGDFKVPLNMMFATRLYFSHGLSLGFFLPVYEMELTNVRWTQVVRETTAEAAIEPNFVGLMERLGCLNLGPWKRTGVGDFLIQGQWMQDFYQKKRLLKDVRVQTRFGVYAPTGKKQDEDLLLAIPFGNDGSWGLQFAGGIDLYFSDYIRGGIDAEFLYLFGNTRNRRVQINRNQTDFLFLEKIPAFREFGLGQQFNLYVEGAWCGFSTKLNYQYLKRNDDKLWLCADNRDQLVVNDAESLQEWSTHSLIGFFNYDFNYYCREWPIVPEIRGWLKWGFNGKRSLLAQTWGIELSLTY